MATFDRILASYEQGLKKLADDLVAQNDPSEEERANLTMLTRVLQAVVTTYQAHLLDRAAEVQATRPITAGAMPVGSGILNVSLRRLVDEALMTPWYARFLNSTLGLKRTIIISGGPQSGKSTLLNALIDLLPRDHRIVSVDDTDEELPVLSVRSFTVQLKAKRGTPARAAVFRKAVGMRPTWVVAGELVRRDGPVFLEALTGSSSGGLTTIQTMDPESSLNEWLAMSKAAAEHLRKLNPLVVHIERAPDENPRVARVVEVTTEKGNLVITPREQVDSEQVGVQGGQRSDLARAEQEAAMTR